MFLFKINEINSRISSEHIPSKHWKYDPILEVFRRKKNRKIIDQQSNIDYRRMFLIYTYLYLYNKINDGEVTLYFPILPIIIDTEDRNIIVPEDAIHPLLRSSV